MSRYISSHEIKKNEKLLNEERLLSASSYREQLKDAINIENHRINIDSAKKKAVLQGMNYDGFHQMVLGADLKSLKSKELQEFKPKNLIMNSGLSHNLLNKKVDFLENKFVPGDKTLEKIENKNLLQNLEIVDDKNYLKENLRNLKKKLKTEKILENKIDILFGIENFESIINSDVLESDIFLDLLITISTYLCVNYPNIQENTKKCCLHILEIVLNHNSYPSLKKFISKKVKSLFYEISSKIEEIFSEPDTHVYYKSISEKILN